MLWRFCLELGAQEMAAVPGQGWLLTEGSEMGSTEEQMSLANTLLVTCVPPRLSEPRTDLVTGARD